LTTTRKFLSILFSIYVFNHPCSCMQFSAILVTFMAVCYNLYTKKVDDENQKSIKTN
jgi:hypothetical protein